MGGAGAVMVYVYTLLSGTHACVYVQNVDLDLGYMSCVVCGLLFIV